MPVDQPVVLDRAGFLQVPTEEAWWIPPETRPRPITDLAGCTSSFVVLAAGGAGKTRMLRRLRGREPGAVEVKLSVLDKSGMREELLKAMAADVPVYLDALDEAELSEPAVFRVLEHHLTTAAASGVPWRLACRPAVWDPLLAEALRGTLPGFAELRLLPLTRVAARELAAEVGAEPGDFLDALIRANLGRLAASPMRLHAAACHWVSTGELPDNQATAIRFEVEQLLAETDRRRRPSLAADRRLRLAARLGAMTVFSGVTRFTRVPGAAAGVLTACDLPSDPEPEEPGTPVTPAQYEEVLGTDLFDAAPDATVSFRHQVYAEYLAAEYVVQRRITRPQLPALLGVNADGLLPGAMAGVAAWITALQPGLTGDLLAGNAASFIQAGVELPGAEARVAIVGAILAKAAKGDTDLLWGQDLSVLAYPDLETHLSQYLNDAPKHPQLLWWIARLAAAGRWAGLVPALAREVTAAKWPGWVCRAGITAIAALADDTEMEPLRPLLHLDQDSDPYDEILAAAVEALYPRLLGTAELLAALRPQRNRYWSGAYQWLLRRLAERIPLAALPEVLDWAASHVQDGADAYEDLFPALVQRAWAHVESPEVRAALARVVAAIAVGDLWPDWQRRHKPPWAGGEPGERRALAVSAAALIGARHSYALISLGLIVASDLSWLLDQLADLPASARDALAACVPALAHHPDAQTADLILGLAPGHPAYAATQGLRELVPVDSEIAQLCRDQHSLRARTEDLQTTNRARNYEHLAAALSDARDDPGAWWHVACRLSTDDFGQRGDDLLSGDLTARPGWSLLNDQEQHDALDLGIRYLATHELQPSAWDGIHPVETHMALPDWSGAYLLMTLARHDPGRIRALDPPTWHKWAPAIVGAWVSPMNKGLQHPCDLADLAPPAGRRFITDAALSHLDALQEHGGLLQQSLYEHLGRDLSADLAERLQSGRYTGNLACNLLGVLIANVPEVAAPACRQLTASSSPELAEAARRGLAQLEPAIIVDELAAADAEADDLAGIVPNINITRLDEARLATLARLLTRRFPFTADPPLQLGRSHGDARDDCRRIRHAVLERLAQLGHVSLLRDLASQLPEPSQEPFTTYLRQARTRAADLALNRPNPSSLLGLLGQADARLVRHSRDLLLVVSDQLEQLQLELSSKGASRYLWNITKDRSTPKSEDDITDWVRNRLAERLSPVTSFFREAQVARKLQGIGTRIDLTASAPTATQPVGTARVIIEAKLVTNTGLMTAMHDQLVQRYLLPEGVQHGIYLIYWTSADQRSAAGLKKDPADRDDLLEELQRQAAAAGPDLCIQPFLLDISLPAEIADRR
jgi:hypothetical protein